VKRFKDTYSICVSLGQDPASGKYKQHFETVKGTKKDAEKRLSELLHEIDKGNFIKPVKLTLSDYLDRWFREYAKPNTAPRTGEVYEQIIRVHLKPALGNIPLTALRPDHLSKYYANKLSSGLAPMTIKHHYALIHTALKTAMKWNILSKNVSENAPPPKVQPKEMQVWNTEEIDHFLEFTKSTPYYALFHLDAYTGMRRSE
jgi:integrase